MYMFCVHLHLHLQMPVRLYELDREATLSTEHVELFAPFDPVTFSVEQTATTTTAKEIAQQIAHKPDRVWFSFQDLPRMTFAGRGGSPLSLTYYTSHCPVFWAVMSAGRLDSERLTLRDVEDARNCALRKVNDSIGRVDERGLRHQLAVCQYANITADITYSADTKMYSADIPEWYQFGTCRARAVARSFIA